LYSIGSFHLGGLRIIGVRRLEIKREATDGNKSQRFSRKIMLVAIKVLLDCG
jgi:hypothetical protein